MLPAMTLPPPAAVPTVGIVGAGQLARMTYQAAIPLGIRVRLLAERPDEAAALVAAAVTLGSPHSAADLAAFAAGCDVVTFDHELVDAAALAALERAGYRIRPPARTVALAQDKRRQRALLGERGFPIPPHRPVDDLAGLLGFAEEHGWPVVAKASRGGYDGRGVWVLDGPEAAEEVLRRAAGAGLELLAEAFVSIARELAVLVARRPGGEAVAYPVVETVQREGICREVLAPSPVPAAIADGAVRMAVEVAEAVGAVGVLALELFVVGDRLLVNEIAARPHNSGHYSIEGCVTSQFEHHLRAVLDWPLGSTALTAAAVATVNVLGGADGVDPLTRLPEALAVEGVHIHLYGKGARPGRKLGHVTALGSTLEEVRARAVHAAELLAGGPVGMAP